MSRWGAPRRSFFQKYREDIRVHFWSDGGGWWLYRTKCSPKWQEGGVIVGKFFELETAEEDAVRRCADDAG